MTKPHLILMKGTDLVDSKGTINEEALDVFMAAIDNAFGIEAQEHSPGGKSHDQKSHGRRGSGGGGGGTETLPEVEEWDAVGGGGGGMEVLNAQSDVYYEQAKEAVGGGYRVTDSSGAGTFADDLDSHNGFASLRDGENRAALKVKVIDELTAATGMKRSTVDQFVHGWTESSSDDNVMSIGLQIAVAEKFGLEVPLHIQDKMAEMGDGTGAEGFRPDDSHIVESRKLVDAIYDRTQKDLKARGIKEMHLVRGMDFTGGGLDALPGEPGNRSGLKPKALREFDRRKAAKIDIKGYSANDIALGIAERSEHRRDTYNESITIEANPLSSYTTDRHTFGNFGGNQTEGYGFAVRVPRKRILSTPFTGIGSLPEFEFVVIGGPTRSKVYGGEALWNVWPRRKRY